MKKLRRLSILPFVLSVSLAFASMFLNSGVTAQSTSANAEHSGKAPAAANLAVLDSSGHQPSVVTVSGQNLSYAYSVNNVPDVIRGVGYNVIYRYLSPEQRAQLYDRDFWLMRTAGINTISGWGEDKGYVQDTFDSLLLDKAQQWGIGVIMPFYLPPDGDYTDPAFRQATLDNLRNMVARYKDYPAIRMWGVGNEVLSVMDNSPQSVPFADFLVQAIYAVHEVDPNHPVIYREAEDTWIPYLRDAFARAGGIPPWFVYGMNVYTFRLGEILANWPSLNFNVPVVISEFAPNGLQGDARAQGYVEMWQQLRDYPSLVMGGLAYVWTTAGPEPVDRNFGLLYSNDVATDDSFNQLAAQYKEISIGQANRY